MIFSLAAALSFQGGKVKDPTLQTPKHGAPGKNKGNCTIGYGHLLEYHPCTQQDYDAYPVPLSDAAADELFFNDMTEAISYVRHYVKVPLAQKEFDVMADFTFNAGGGSLQRSQVLSILNLELYPAVPNALVTQNILPGSSVEQGLRNRRQDEAYLWVTGIYRAHGIVIP